MKRLFVVGDSISIGYGPYLARLLRPEFSYARKRKLPATPAGYSFPAEANAKDSRMVLSYLEYLCAKKRHYDILLLNCGLHDIKSARGKNEVPLPEYRENLRKIAKLAKRLAKRVVWVSSTPVYDGLHNQRMQKFQRYNRDVIGYNKAAAAIMRAKGVRVLDLYRFTLGFGPDALVDHIHFTPEVRRQQAAHIAAFLLGRPR